MPRQVIPRCYSLPSPHGETIEVFTKLLHPLLQQTNKWQSKNSSSCSSTSWQPTTTKETHFNNKQKFQTFSQIWHTQILHFLYITLHATFHDGWFFFFSMHIVLCSYHHLFSVQKWSEWNLSFSLTASNHKKAENPNANLTHYLEERERERGWKVGT